MKVNFPGDKVPEILIADDTLESLQMLSETLSVAGYDVRSVNNGSLAFKSAAIAPPDLILLDIKMPDLSGYEVCQKLKENQNTRDIPVIFISALHESFDKIQAFDVGGLDYITKPFQIEEVLARIQSHLALHFATQKIQLFNENLEKRVAERTKIISEQNRQLLQEILDRQKIEIKLRESEIKLRQISEYIDEVFWLINYDEAEGIFTNIEYVSPAFEKVWHMPIEELYKSHGEWANAIHKKDRQRVCDAFQNQAIYGQFNEEYQIINPDGSSRWIHDRGYPIHNEKGQIYRVAGIAQDITSRKQAEIERDRIFNLSLDLLFIADENGKLKHTNPIWINLLGYQPNELENRLFRELVHPEDASRFYDYTSQLQQGKEINAMEVRCRCKDGSYLWTAWNIVPFLQENLLYGAGRNISKRKESEARLVYETLHDTLTGLANRTCFMQHVEIAIKQEKRLVDNLFSVLFIDLDNFKQINDTLGHLLGDKLLIAIAKVLQESVREIDLVARLGGDEFIILLSEHQQLQDVIKVVDRIQDYLKKSFHIGEYEIFSTASIGIVIGISKYQNVADVIRDADIAMYRAKAQGKNTYAIFDQKMYSEILRWVELETSLRQAIANKEFRLHYQPIVNLKNNLALEGFEVLLRWHHPEKGMIPASEFIPIAEDTGEINAIGAWVLQQACTKFQSLAAIYQNFKSLYLSINMSGRQLKESGFLQTLTETIEKTKIPAHCIKLEITETSLIDNTEIAVGILDKIKAKGIKTSLDDFGTGFSSLRYLHQFPIDVIKIDRSFLQNLNQGRRERSIVHSIIALAKALDFQTVAEGIETLEQLNFVRTAGCDAAQGYFFAKPMGAEKLPDFLEQQGFEKASITTYKIA